MRGTNALGCLILAALLASLSGGVQICEQKIADCEGDSCLKSIQCYHGDCNEAGTCECDLCWEGESCQSYVDNFLPEFIKTEETVIVSDPWSTDSIYTPQAYDGDLGTSCPVEAMLCDCAEISYTITDGDPERIFFINNITGDMYIKEASKVVSGGVYNLTITASTTSGKVSSSHNAHMKLKVIIDDRHHHLEQVLRQNVITWLGDNIIEEEESHSRRKRSTDNENYLTEFNFNMTSGELETMSVGRRLDYRLEIIIPKTDSMDMTLELFTKEVGNGNYTPVLGLFNVMMDDKPDGLTFSVGDEPELEMLLSDEIMTVYDRAIMNFGNVKNKNDNPVSIYIMFSVTQIKNPATLYETKYLVTAGAEYDKETYIWVGQSEVTVHNSTDDRNVEIELIGPDEIPLDSAGVYVMKTHCAVRSDNFTFDVYGPTESDIVTVGNLGVKDFDVNYDPVPQNIYFYNTTREGNDDTVIYTSQSMNLGIMTNVGDYEKPKDEGNVINVTFAIYALNNETHIDKEVEITMTVTVGRDVLATEKKTIKIVPRKDADKMVDARKTAGDLTTRNVGIGDMAMYTLWSNLTNDGYADYVMEVSINMLKGIPRLEACSARLWNYPKSFDVPYLNTSFIDPEVVDGKFIFKFNRIHVTGQRNPAIYNDSMIYVHLIMKVSALSVNKEGVSLRPTVKIGTQGSATTDVPVPSLTIQEKGDYTAPIMVVENGVAWPYLYLGGAIVLNVSMWVPEGQGYAEVFMEASGENNPPLPAVHICRAELSEVGRNVPCLRMHQDEVNANFTKYSKTDPKNRLKPDMTSIMLGDVGALPVEGKNFATVSVVVELPPTAVIKDDESYPISSGLLISSNTIWSAMANYTMKKSAPPELEEEQFPDASVHYNEDEKVMPGHLAEVEVWVDTKIQTISTVTIEVEGVTNDISLCGLKVKDFGRNLPCVDKETEPYYHPHDNPLDGNKVAGLKFMALSNIGFRSNLEHDRLKALALIRIGPSCKKPEAELLWKVTYGGGVKEGKIAVKVDLEADGSDTSMNTKEAKDLAFREAYPNKAISMGTPVVVDLDVSLEPGSLAPVIVEIKNVDAQKKLPYDMCLGGVWFRGRNYPCFSPVQVEKNFSSSDSDNGHNDTAIFNLGLVCNTFVDNKEEENKVTIRVAMRPLDDGTLKIRDTFEIEGYATVGKHRKKINNLKFKIAREPDQVETKVDATVQLLQEDPYPIKVHQRIWIPFNITIPIDAVVKVTAEARAPVSDNRAILTVHNMRLKSGGVNIPCPMLYPQPTVVLNSTTPTTQKDVARAYIGYFTNLGLSQKMNMAQKGDDDLTVEVEVEMSDHPLTVHEKEFKLKFIAEVGKAVIEVEQPVEVRRDGTERADLDVKVLVDSSKPYQSGDHINITVHVHHKNESTAEPVNATVRLYLPPYVVFDSKIFNNATVVGEVKFIPDNGGLDIVLPQFLFYDSATIVVSLLADPNNERGFGRGEINATTPYRVLCLQTYREEPSANPATADTVVNCGPIDYIMYVVNSQECYKVLGLNSPKKIYKCQLSASSAARKDLGPYNIRSGSKRGWSPALRLGPHKPYFQVDFLRTTRVSKLEFMQVEETRFVTKYRLQYSHTGSDWLYANEVTELKYKKNGKAFDELERPIQTRFIRIVIEEAEDGEEDTKYIGLKMELYGCYLAEKSPSVSCAKNDPTWYSDDKNKYGRHFSVDTGRDILYFCDLEYDMVNLVCFSTVDTGSSWRILPRSVGGVIGYDKKLGRTYAFDKRKRAYIASDDGNNWIAVDEAEVNNTLAKKTFYRSQPVPAFTTEDIEMLETKTGRWEASFDGLMYEGKADPRARWSRCCKMK